MAIEIERKFLVPRPPTAERLAGRASELIEQGYLAITDDVEVRVRRRGDRAYLTVKSTGGVARVEEELAIDEARFAALWPLTEGRRVSKRRYLIPAGGGLTIELDVYAGALEGLCVAEVEFADAAAARAFAPPDWLGEDVSEDAAFKNRSLAVHGRPRRA